MPSDPTRRPDAVRALIESHIPLVRAVARRYVGRGETLEDLVQVGSIGLVRASDRFDPSRGVSFAAFAAPAIEGEIQRHLGDRSDVLRIPRDLQRTTARVGQCRSALGASLGRPATVAELATELGIDEREVEQALEVERLRDAVRFATEAGVESAAEPESLADSEDRLALAGSMHVLDERERQILFLRFHRDMTERQIAEAVGISQAQVSRVLAGALAKLREELAGKKPPVGADITANTVISRSLGDQPASADARKIGSSGPGGESAANKIGPVGAAARDPKLAHYLSLPYHVTVRSDASDTGPGWTAAVEELPGCEAQGSTPDEAAEQLRAVMEQWLTAALADRREIPAPSRDASRQRSAHSGRFLVRMPSELHEQLARAAEREQVSLNRFVTDALAASVTQGGRARSVTAAEPATEKTDPGRPSGQLQPVRSIRIALATNMVVVVVAGLIAVVLLVLALERGL
jgi:RNA polymerase sigma-B factor